MSLMAILVIAGTSAVAPPVIPPPCEIADRFFGSMIVEGNFWTSYTIRFRPMMSWSEGEDPPSEESRPEGEIQFRTVQSWYLGDRCRHEEVLIETTGSGQRSEVNRLHIWDGLYHYDLTKELLTVRRHAPGAVTGTSAVGGLFDLVVGRYPIQTDLDRDIRQGHTIDTTLEDGLLTHRFTLPDADRTIITIIADWEPVFRLREFRMDVTGNHDIRNFGRFIVDEWTETEGRALPRRARYIGASFNMPNHENQ